MSKCSPPKRVFRVDFRSVTYMNERENTKRVAKNTLLLYIRMIMMMLIGLFTSRVMLQSLGIENYGVNNVVGGFLGMFNIITASMTNAVSRFITVELGHNDKVRQQKVFATTVSVMIFMSILMVIIIETVGLWFLNTGLNIPEERMTAANWVLHCAAIGTFWGLISVPYNSAIVAHERMSVFAYMTILDAIFKLGICYAIYITPFDRLISFAVLGLIIVCLMQWIYFHYCKRHFEECRYDWSFKKDLFKEIWSFAGWNFFAQTAWILNTQGLNMLMNIYYGVLLNAARGVADQVNSKINGFVGNFMTALNPQITKSYASGNKEYAFKLASRGARFSFYIMFFLGLPIMIESSFILCIWLGMPPQQADTFVVWTIIQTLMLLVGNPLVTLQMAEGNIKHYQIVMTVWGCLPFPLVWIAFELGAPAVSSYWIFTAVYWCLIFVRYRLVHGMTGIPAKMYLGGVIVKCHIVVALSVILPLLIHYLMDEGFYRLFSVVIVSLISSGCMIYFYGMEKEERRLVVNGVGKMYHKIVER